MKKFIPFLALTALISCLSGQNQSIDSNNEWENTPVTPFESGSYIPWLNVDATTNKGDKPELSLLEDFLSAEANNTLSIGPDGKFLVPSGVVDPDEDPENELNVTTVAAVGDGSPIDGTNDPVGVNISDLYEDEEGGLWIWDGVKWEPFDKTSYLYGWAGGQSNMRSADVAANAVNYTYDSTPLVEVWANGAWETFDPAVAQYANEAVGEISPAIYGARKLAEDTGSTVRVFVNALGSEPINGWVPTSGAQWTAFAADYAAAGSPHLAFAWWLQGESNNPSTTSGQPLTRLEYVTELNALIDQVRALGTRGSATTFTAGALVETGSGNDSGSHATWYQNGALASLNTDQDPRTRFVDFSHLAARTNDDVHYSGESYVAIGVAFADAHRTPNFSECGVVLDLDANERFTGTTWTDDETEIEFTADSGTPVASTLSDGRPAIDMGNGRFTGTFDFEQTSTVMVLYESDAADNLSVLFEAAGSSATDATGFVTGNGASTANAAFIRSGVLVNSGAGTVTHGEPKVATFEFATPHSRIYLDRELILDESATGDNTGSNTFHIGNSDSNGSSSNVKIARVIVFNCVLPDHERGVLVSSLLSGGGASGSSAITAAVGNGTPQTHVSGDATIALLDPFDPSTTNLTATNQAAAVEELALSPTGFTDGLGSELTEDSARVHLAYKGRGGDTLLGAAGNLANDGAQKLRVVTDSITGESSARFDGTVSLNQTYNETVSDLYAGAELEISPKDAGTPDIHINAPNILGQNNSNSKAGLRVSYKTRAQNTVTDPISSLSLVFTDGAPNQGNEATNYSGFRFFTTYGSPNPDPLNPSTSAGVFAIDAHHGNFLTGNDNGNPQPSANEPDVDRVATHGWLAGRGAAPAATTTTTAWGNLWYDTTTLSWRARSGGTISTFASHNLAHCSILGLTEADDAWLLGASNGENLFTLKGMAQLKSDPSIVATYSLETGEWSRTENGKEVASGVDERLKLVTAPYEGDTAEKRYESFIVSEEARIVKKEEGFKTSIKELPAVIQAKEEVKKEIETKATNLGRSKKLSADDEKTLVELNKELVAVEKSIAEDQFALENAKEQLEQLPVVDKTNPYKSKK